MATGDSAGSPSRLAPRPCRHGPEARGLHNDRRSTRRPPWFSYSRPGPGLIVVGADLHVDAQFSQQRADAALDVVANRPNRVHGLAGWVGQSPLLVAPTGKHRAGITTAHGYHHV